MAESEHGEPQIEADDESLGGPEGSTRVRDIVARELGEAAAQTFSEVWRAFDDWDQRRNPGEGLRARKKRQTRQRISDIATAMFVSRGFDSVTVSEIAEKVGVSEKTVYNYFPTKESLVFDQADEQLDRLVEAVRGRPEGTSPTLAFVGALKVETARFAETVGKARLEFLPAFGELIRQTPALRAAWGEYRHRVVSELTEVLAADFGVDPRDPEPLVAARGLVSLLELYNDAQLRRVSDGMTAAALQAAVESDIDRGARLLETGLWSLHLMVEGRRTKQQLLDAAAAAEQARRQVLAALRDAKKAWRDLRTEARAAVREQRAIERIADRNERAADRSAQQAAHQAAKQAARRKHGHHD